MIPAMARPDAAASLQELLLRAVDFPGTGLRLLDRAEKATFLSWSGVAERAATVAGGLAALGVAPGERVALVYPTGAEFFDAFFGTLFAGAVPVPLYPPVRLGRLAEDPRVRRAGPEDGAVAVEKRDGVAALLDERPEERLAEGREPDVPFSLPHSPILMIGPRESRIVAP